jgi:FlaA1/EpsC-like NDP-sugar epimerase
VDLIEVLKKSMGANNEVEEVGIRPGEKIHEILINEFEIPLTYQYENIYAISSLIEEYQSVIGNSVYKEEGEMIDSSKMKEYSSKDHLVPPDKLMDYLKKLDLL